MRTTVAMTLARPAREQVDPRLLNIDEDVQQIYVRGSDRVLSVLARLGLRWQWVRRRRTDQAYRALGNAARDLVTLWNAGATEAELRPMAAYLNDVLDRVSTGCAQRPLSALDQEDTLSEGRENALQTERMIIEGQGGRAPADLLLREAAASEYEAGINIERSRVLRRRARQTASSFACLLLPIASSSTIDGKEIQISVLVATLIPTLLGIAMWFVLRQARRGSERHRSS